MGTSVGSTKNIGLEVATYYLLYKFIGGLSDVNHSVVIALIIPENDANDTGDVKLDFPINDSQLLPSARWALSSMPFACGSHGGLMPVTNRRQTLGFWLEVLYTDIGWKGWRVHVKKATSNHMSSVFST